MGKQYRNETRFTTTTTTETGEVINLAAVNIQEGEFFYVKNLNGRMNMNDLATAMELSCRSARDIKLFFMILNRTEFKTKLNVTRIAKAYEVSRVTITNLLKRMVEANAIYKTKAGEYLINPFMAVTVNNNEEIERRQNEWSILRLETLEEDEVVKQALNISDIQLDFPYELLQPGKKTYQFLESLLKGHAVYGKLTDKQKDVVANMVIKTRMLLIKSEYKDKLDLTFNLKHFDDFTDQEKMNWNVLKGVERLHYWYYEMNGLPTPSDDEVIEKKPITEEQIETILLGKKK